MCKCVSIKYKSPIKHILTRTRNLFDILQCNSFQEFRIVILDEEPHKILARIQFQRQRLADLRSGSVDYLPKCFGQLKGTLVWSLMLNHIRTQQQPNNYMSFLTDQSCQIQKKRRRIP